MRWRAALGEPGPRPRASGTGGSRCALVMANLIAGNLWLGQLSWARAGPDRGQRLSTVARRRGTYLRQLAGAAADARLFQQPRPIRCWRRWCRSCATCSPEYEVAGRARCSVEFVDPAQESRARAGGQSAATDISRGAVPDRRPSPVGLVNAYFNLLVTTATSSVAGLSGPDRGASSTPTATSPSRSAATPNTISPGPSRRCCLDYRRRRPIVFSVMPAEPITLMVYAPRPSNCRRRAASSARAYPQPVIGELSKSPAANSTARFIDPDEQWRPARRAVAGQYGAAARSRSRLLDAEAVLLLPDARRGDKAVQVPLPETLDKAALQT